MTTGIRGCQNDSDRWVSVINHENRGDSRICGPNRFSDLYFWISQHGESRPSIQTKKGLMWIQDDNWKIMGEWEWGGNKIELANVESQPQDYRLNISAEGDISLTKL